MKLPSILFLLFISLCVEVSAQTILITKKTNIFGDTITTYQDRNKNTLGELKQSETIFGDRLKVLTGPDGRIIRSSKKSKDIFGNKIITVSGSNGQILATMKESVDIFGDTTIRIDGDADSELIDAMLNYLSEP